MVRNFGSPSVYTKNRLRFRARVPGGWVSAAVTTAQKRLGDVLNVESGQVGPTIVEDLVFEREGGSELRAEFGSLNLAQAQLVIPVEEGDAGPAANFEWVRKRPNLVRVGLEAAEIVGDMYLAEGQLLREVIVRPVPPFIPLTAARLTHSRTGRTEEHRIIFVNRKLATFIAPEG